jgi:hypothetical protein
VYSYDGKVKNLFFKPAKDKRGSVQFSVQFRGAGLNRKSKSKSQPIGNQKANFSQLRPSKYTTQVGVPSRATPQVKFLSKKWTKSWTKNVYQKMDQNMEINIHNLKKKSLKQYCLLIQYYFLFLLF